MGKKDRRNRISYKGNDIDKARAHLSSQQNSKILRFFFLFKKEIANRVKAKKLKKAICKM